MTNALRNLFRWCISHCFLFIFIYSIFCSKSRTAHGDCLRLRWTKLVFRIICVTLCAIEWHGCGWSNEKYDFYANSAFDIRINAHVQRRRIAYALKRNSADGRDWSHRGIELTYLISPSPMFMMRNFHHRSRGNQSNWLSLWLFLLN